MFCGPGSDWRRAAGWMLLWRSTTDSTSIVLSNRYTVTSSLCHFCAVDVFYYLKELRDKPFVFFFFFDYVKWLGALEFCHSITHPMRRLGRGQYVTDFPFSTQFPSEREYTCKGRFFYCVVYSGWLLWGFSVHCRGPVQSSLTR